MKIGLIDVDSHNFPNLALMKLSAYHKKQGNIVILINNPMEVIIEHFDIVYKSKIFTFSLDEYYNINADIVKQGGSGYDLKNKLPYEIEHMYPDYDLYSQYDFAVGFLTRGCPRNCEFCIVSQKEGMKVPKVADLSEFWNGQKEIQLLDNNILASPDKYDLLQQLVDSKASVKFHGLDIRLIDDKAMELLNNIKSKEYNFAWDNYEFKTYEKLKKYRPMMKFDKRKLIVYVLVNFNTTIEQDLERIYKLRELDYSPYVMIYDKHKLRKGHIYKKMQRWVNNRFIWYSNVNFDEYLQNKN